VYTAATENLQRLLGFFLGCRCGGDGMNSGGDGKVLIVDATGDGFSGDGSGRMFGCIRL
jgi:hypothetical protein